MRLTALAATVVSGGLTALTACGHAAPTAAVAPEASATADPCALVSAREVHALVRASISAVPDEQRPLVQCDYRDQAGQTVVFVAAKSGEQLDFERDHDVLGVTVLDTGLGEESFHKVTNPALTQVYVRSAEVRLLVSGSYADQVPVTLEQLRQIALRALS